MELFFKDKHFLFSKYKNHEISEETADFFNKNMQKLLGVNETISIEYFRKQEYQRLIDEYCGQRDTAEKSKQEIKKPAQIQIKNKSEAKKSADNIKIELSDIKDAPVNEARLYGISKK